MRIPDKYIPSPVSAQNEKTSPGKKVGDGGSSTGTASPLSTYGDSAEASSLSGLLERAMGIGSDSATIEQLRTQVQNGTYEVDIPALSKVLAREFTQAEG